MESWDYIIVGAGSAGCVLANRLSADPATRVLLIEEGPADDSWLIRMPKGIGKIFLQDTHVHRYRTTHVEGGAAEVWTRGKTLGGSSSVNGMVWMRGQPEDYDEWEAMGNRGWGWADMAPCFRALEDHALGDDGVRGVGGPIEVRSHANRTRLADAFIASGEALGLPRKAELNTESQEGIGYLAHNIDRRGTRVSAARAFLKPARGRANLRVVTGVRIDRIDIENGRAVGVSGRRGGEAVRFAAAGEVIVSAGAIVSPKLLQLSGIGPADHLRASGVPVLVDSPGVGGNLREHRLLFLRYVLKYRSDSQNGAYKGLGLAISLARYALFRSGPMALGAFDAAAFVRTMPGLNRPDGQLMFAPWARARGGGLATDATMSAFGYLLRPESVGTIRIDGADPDTAPVITPNYLTADYDRRHAVALVRFLRRVMEQPQLRALVDAETDDTAWAQSDEQILEAIRTLGGAGSHACGTCAMGNGPDAVVDDRLRVRGVDRLRVMDLSIFPTMVSGNTNAPTMAAALRASELIVQDRRGAAG